MSDASERRLATAWGQAFSTTSDAADFMEKYPGLYWSLLHWHASHGERALASIRDSKR